MAPSLAELPTELLQMICRNLCYHCGQSRSGRRLNVWDHREELQRERLGLEALWSLCLVNKLLCWVAQPVLYHHLSSFYWDWRGRSRPLLLPFLRTLHEIPRLAESTRELDVRYIISVETQDHRLPALLRKVSGTTTLGTTTTTTTTPTSRLVENALIQSLLCATPRLETACLGILPGWSFSSLAPGRLASLKTLSLTGPAGAHDFQDGIDHLLAAACNLQALRLQELTYCAPSHLLRNLRRLELCQVPMHVMGPARLRDMLGLCTALAEFHYHGPSFDAGVTRMGALGAELAEALAPARASLRCLHISYANHTPCIKNTHVEIASLKSFARLERIHLGSGLGAVARRPKRYQHQPHQYQHQQYQPPFWTFGKQSFADILPRSVKVFCPPCWPESLLDMARSLHEQQQGEKDNDDDEQEAFPNLKRVEMEHGLSTFGDFSNSRVWKSKRVLLEQTFAARGVDVSFERDGDLSPQWHIKDI